MRFYDAMLFGPPSGIESISLPADPERCEATLPG